MVSKAPFILHGYLTLDRNQQDCQGFPCCLDHTRQIRKENFQGHMHIRLIVSYLCSPCVRLHQLNPSWKALQCMVPSWTGASAILCTALRLSATLGRNIMTTRVPVLWVPYPALCLPLIIWFGCISPHGLSLWNLMFSESSAWSHRSPPDLERIYYSEWGQRDVETEQMICSLQPLMTGADGSMSSRISWRLFHWILIITTSVRGPRKQTAVLFQKH